MSETESPAPAQPVPLSGTGAVVEQTRRWLERAVIGLNLCPFAKAVAVKDQIRFTVTDVTTPTELMEVLVTELRLLAEADASRLDTTLLIHPHVLTDFLDFNWFMELADQALEQMGLEGVLQVAHFHPQFQFADTAADDITNYTNRSPYPTLHLLREDSVDRAVDAFPDAAAIYQKNMATLRALGHQGWQALDVNAS